MANSGLFYPTILSLLLIILFDLCCSEYFYPPSLRSSYYGSYLYRPRRYYYGYGRRYGSRWSRPGLDRLSSGLIKRAEVFNDKVVDDLNFNEDEVDNDDLISPYSDEQLQYIIQRLYKAAHDVDKRAFDRITSGFIRRKRSSGSENENMKTRRLRKRSTDENLLGQVEKRSDRALAGDEVNKSDGFSKGNQADGLQLSKKSFDRLSSSFVKKSDGETDSEIRLNAISETRDYSNKQANSETDKSKSKDKEIPALSAKTLSKSSDEDSGVEESKENIDWFDESESEQEKRRGFDRLTSGFVKRRGFDRLTSGFVKRPGFDRLRSGFVKRRGFDRMASGFVKRRGFDRLTSGFVKRRGFDRLTSGFVKKEDDKRGFDRLTSGFVKKDDEKRRGFDRLSSAFVKKDNEDIYDDVSLDNFNDDKRYIDRMTSGFVKKDVDKRRLDRLTSGFVKKDDDKRRFDRLTSGFVKKSESHNNFEPKSTLNADTEGFHQDIHEMGDYYKDLKDDERVNYNEDNFNSNDMTDRKLHLSIEENIYDGNNENNEKRRIDRVGYEFIQRNDEATNFIPVIGKAQTDLQKRYFDRLTSGFVKKAEVPKENFNKRRFDRLYSGFVKRPYSENPDIDRINFGTGNQIENEASSPYLSDSDIPNTISDYGNDDINIPGVPLNRKKRSFYGITGGMFPVTGNRFVGRDGDYFDNDDYATEQGINEIQKRRLDRLTSGFVKKRSKFNAYDDLFEKSLDDSYNRRHAMFHTGDNSNSL